MRTGRQLVNLLQSDSPEWYHHHHHHHEEQPQTKCCENIKYKVGYVKCKSSILKSSFLFQNHGERFGACSSPEKQRGKHPHGQVSKQGLNSPMLGDLRSGLWFKEARPGSMGASTQMSMSLLSQCQVNHIICRGFLPLV